MRLFGKISITTALLLMLFSLRAGAQTIATVPYSCDFENSSERANWRFFNSGINEWFIDTAAYNNGNYGMYISAYYGQSPVYYQLDSSNSYACREIHLDAGLYNVSFYWTFFGAYTNYIVNTYMRVFLIPSNTVFTGGVRYPGVSASRLPSNAIPIDFSGAQPVWDPNWNHFTNPMVRVPVTGNYYLVFFFFCNNFSPSHIQYGDSPVIDDISITAAPCPQPYALTKTNTSSGCISLDWEDAQVPAPTQWEVEWGGRGFFQGLGTVVNTTTKPVTICGLLPDSVYDFYVRAKCSDGSMGPRSQVLRMRYKEQVQLCRDFSDLKSQGTICTYGQYEEFNDTIGEFYGPYSDTGILNYGYQNYGDPVSMLPASRHTVHYDPYATDANTGYFLYTVPPDCDYSVRLGCKYGKWICQSISYQINVDTSTTDMLMLKYAPVLYNPEGHIVARKPRFILQLLDSQNNLVNPTCGYIDLTANNASMDSTWHQGPDYSTCWKEWTTMGVDLSSYHGQTITARLSSFACGQGATDHFGYAYFNLDCKKAPFKVLYCAATGTPDSLVLEAPEGFKYRWYSNDYPNFSSDSRRITVPADSATYFCEITFLNTNRCGKTVTMVASPSHNGGSYTHADFAFIKEIANCTYNLRLINNSYTSDARQTYRDYNCDYFFWDFGDSTTSDQESPGVHTYAEHGTYTIMLVAGNTELQCYDTIYKTVSFDPPEVPLLASDTIVCVGDSFALIVQGSTLDSFLWSSGDSTRVFSRTMGHIPFILSVRVVDTLGCVTLLNTRVIPDSVPVPMFDSLYFASCNPLKVHFTDRNPRSSENIMYKWYWGTGDSIETSDSVEYLYSEPGMYDIRCVVNSVNGCADTVRARAFSYNYTKAEFHWETFFGRITAPDMHFLNRSAPHEPEQNYYRWVFFADSAGTDSLFTSYDFEPSYRWPVADNSDVGFYRVRLVAYTPIRSPYFDEFTCADSVDRIIYILNDFLQFPNTVTPNGDGVNDIFEIKNLIDGGNFTENEIYIYNQWGRLVYHKKNISTREDFWDPSLTNEPTGTYYYRFYAKGNTGPVQRNGVIELLR